MDDFDKFDGKIGNTAYIVSGGVVFLLGYKIGRRSAKKQTERAIKAATERLSQEFVKGVMILPNRDGSKTIFARR